MDDIGILIFLSISGWTFAAYAWLIRGAYKYNSGYSAGQNNSKEICSLAVNSCAEEIVTLQRQLSQAEARSSELLDTVVDFQKQAWRALDADYVDKYLAHSMKEVLNRAAKITGEVDPDDVTDSPFVLRKQAEAVEAARDETCAGSSMTSWHWKVLTDYAQRLRQQADELEK